MLTERLILRAWRDEDAEAMAEINRDPEVTRFLNRPVDGPAVAAFHAVVADHWAQHGFGFWALERRDTGAFIGFTGVAHPTFLPELASRPELGWRLARDAWGQGFASEAASAARDDAFARLGLDELISIIHPDNERSQRLARNLGMTVARRVHNPVLGRQVDVWRGTSAGVVATPASRLLTSSRANASVSGWSGIIRR